MSDKVSNGSSEDLAGLGSILKNISNRPSASTTREKIIAINSRAQRSMKQQWENDLSSGPLVTDTGYQEQSNHQSELPVHITTPDYQSSFPLLSSGKGAGDMNPLDSRLICTFCLDPSILLENT
jgi:hypothetical protein